MYKILILILSLSLFSCAGSKVGVDVATVYSNTVIDEELEPVLTELLYSLETIDNGLKPVDINYEEFQGLNGTYNCLISTMSADIEKTGTLIYEDYKEQLLQLHINLETLADRYPDSGNSVVTILMPYIQDISVRYARMYVAREFKRKFQYGTERCKLL